jgi:hypothetical protein
MDLHLLIQHRTKAINLKKNAELKIWMIDFVE